MIAMLVFGVSIASAIWVFGKNNINTHRDELINEINHIAADAFQYRLRPVQMGGGGGSYTGYHIPSKLVGKLKSSIDVETLDPYHLSLTATSSLNVGSVKATMDEKGKLSDYSYSGQFIE